MCNYLMYMEILCCYSKGNKPMHIHAAKLGLREDLHGFRPNLACCDITRAYVVFLIYRGSVKVDTALVGVQFDSECLQIAIM